MMSPAAMIAAGIRFCRTGALPLRGDPILLRITCKLGPESARCAPCVPQRLAIRIAPVAAMP